MTYRTTKKMVFFAIITIFCVINSKSFAQQEETNIIALLQSALSQAIKTFNSQNQPEAILQLNQIIDICQENMSSRELSDEEDSILAQAYEFRGRAFYNIGETDKAQADFEELIKIMPRYQLDSTLVSPKIISLFDNIKGSLVGNLAVFSTPSGCEVFINNSLLSLTPMYSTELLKGEYLLEVKHKGYDDYSERITILPNTPLEKEVTLTPNTGTCIFFTSPSEVKIYIDDEFVGSTFGQASEDEAGLAEQFGIPLEKMSAPLKIEYVEPGTHRLELRKECFAPIVRSISLEIKVHLFEPFIMEPSLTSIQVNSSIPGSSVYLNDAFKGITPLTLQNVCTGKYTMTVKKEGKGKWFQQVELKRNEPQIFETNMRPTLTYMGIINGHERDQNTVKRVNKKLESIFSTITSVNLMNLPQDLGDKVAREIGMPLSAISEYSLQGNNMDAKKKTGILKEIGKNMETDMLIYAYLPEEKLQRHVYLELYSVYHNQADTINLSFNDPEQTSKFVKRMDTPLTLFKNWIGIITIDTFLHDGILVVNVLPNSPAQAAGVKVGDVISKLNDSPISNNKEFNAKLAAFSEGEKIKVKLTTSEGLTNVLGINVSTSPIELPRNSPTIYYNNAIAGLKQLIRVEKDKSLKNFYQLNLGLCYMHFNNWQKAIEDAFSQTSLPQGSGISAGTLNYYIANCYQNLGYTDEAKKFFQHATNSPGATLESNDGPAVDFMAKKKLAEFD